jgi:hypothetical protein
MEIVTKGIFELARRRIDEHVSTRVRPNNTGQTAAYCDAGFVSHSLENGGSTEVALTLLRLQLAEKLVERENITVAFTDIANAFGSIPTGSVYPVIRAYGIDHSTAAVLGYFAQFATVKVVNRII